MSFKRRWSGCDSLEGDITPDADNTRNMGSTSERFANVYTKYLNAGNSSDYGVVRVYGPAGSWRSIELYSANSRRYALTADASNESGSDAGSDFQLRVYNDSGSYKFTAIHIERDTGRIHLRRALCFDALARLCSVAIKPSDFSLASGTGGSASAEGQAVRLTAAGNNTPGATAYGSFDLRTEAGGSTLDFSKRLALHVRLGFRCTDTPSADVAEWVCARVVYTGSGNPTLGFYISAEFSAASGQWTFEIRARCYDEAGNLISNVLLETVSVSPGAWVERDLFLDSPGGGADATAYVDWGAGSTVAVGSSGSVGGARLHVEANGGPSGGGDVEVEVLQILFNREW